MRRSPSLPFAATIACLAVACSSGSENAGPPIDPACIDAGDPPTSLDCTGLYSNLATKVLSPTAIAYTPAVPLWADSADKLRWIEIPDGGTIDRSIPTEWSFPVGTKVWKEFSYGGKRVETRYFHKQSPNFWTYNTYVWNADDSAAIQSAGGSIPMPGDVDGVYVVPAPEDCEKCHKGATDHLLGFEEVSLGLKGATGLTLAQLAAKGLLTPPPPLTALEVGDDGTGQAAAPMEWLHINCGRTCHNTNQNATAYGAGMYLRLDPTQLDGRSSVDFDTRTTTIGKVSTTPSYGGGTRIVSGDPSESLIYQLISNRTGNQMPPIASRVVDAPDDALVKDWIARMPAAHVPMDAGVKDAAEDAKDAADDAKDATSDAHEDVTSDAHEDVASDAHEDAHGDATVDAHGGASPDDAGPDASDLPDAQDD